MSQTVQIVDRMLQHPPVATRLILHALHTEMGNARYRLAYALGRLAAVGTETHPLWQQVMVLARDADAKTARFAIRALGEMPGQNAESFLLALWFERNKPEDQSAIAEALGACGTAQSLSTLRRVDRSVAPRLQQVVAQACLRIERRFVQETQGFGSICTQVSWNHHIPLFLHCRQGLESTVVQQVRRFLPHASTQLAQPGRVEIQSNPLKLQDLFAIRTWTECAFRVPFASEHTLSQTLAEALAPHGLMAVLTEGPLRYRLQWLQGGRQRTLMQRVIQEVTQKQPHAINDPTRSLWEIQIDSAQACLWLLPKALPDPRFSYRQADVPAASHPTIAAALAWHANPAKGDAIWDPFVGSGTELIELAKLQPDCMLYGSDVDTSALQAAQKNSKCAGASVRLQSGDALALRVPKVNLIVTNPPMGRRLHYHDIQPFLQRFLDHAARILPAGGKLVWISPFPQQHAQQAKQLHLQAMFAQSIDMNGFFAEIQGWQKRTI